MLPKTGLWKGLGFFSMVLLMAVPDLQTVLGRNASAKKACPNQELILPCRCLLRDKEFQVWCSHSDLPRVLEGLKSLSQYLYHPIDELILENNNLPSLPGKAFLPLKVMRLMLRYNNLERVSNGWLSGLEDSLMELYIVEPDLRSLPEESLLGQNHLEAVTLQCSSMKRLPNFSNLPKLRYIKVESTNLLQLSPRHYIGIPNLEKLHISGSPRLEKLEPGFLQDLPSLQHVNISYCGITWIHLRSITRLVSLKELSLVGNRIQDAGMVGRAARDLPNLEILRLDNNLIDILPEASFVDLKFLSELYLSNNEITELQRGAFHRVPKLKKLDLNNNRIRRVHPEAFLQRSGSGIEELWMTHNDINHIVELGALLEALPRLTFLDMSFNNLETIPFGALRGHATLEYLRLDYNKLHLIEREAFMAMPALRELRLKNNSITDRLEAPFWNLPNLKGLDLSENFLRRITPRLLANVPELRKVDLSNNAIHFVDSDSFLMCADLEHVNLSQNALSTLHPATFRHLLGLYELDVSHNALIEFVPGLPRGIEYLFMSHNTISNLPQQPSPDLDLPQLRMLDLSWNNIQNIPKGALKTMPQLKKLYLAKNGIVSLEDGILDGLNKLEVLDVSQNRIAKLRIYGNFAQLEFLDLSDNRLDLLSPDMLQGAENLKKLDVSRNELTEIVSGTLERTKLLEEMDASHNNLVNLPPGLYGMKNLKILDLTDNRLNNINPDTLSSLVSLEKLRMSHNFLHSLRRGAFDSLQNLRILELDNNELSELETKAVHALPQLKNLKLNHNRLKEIPNAAFSNLPSLQSAELQENELRLIGPNAFHHVPHLLMLNISKNHFVGLEDAGLRSVRSLEMLDLSNNQLGHVSSPSLGRMEWLVELRMDNNKICSVQGATFNGMPRLRVLSLRNNKMMTFPEHAVQKLRGNIAVLDIDGNPLACTCSLLWLRAWLQEQAVMGPRCIDGTLLREVRLSRQECQNDSNLNDDPVAPGCEAELLTAPGTSYGTSQVFNQAWVQHNRTKHHEKNNHLVPSPEESDYFYDEYVDYPYNETLLQQSNKSKFNSSHYTPGDTPVIYAAANKNKTQDTPKGVVGSPSSSGFTFFGLPLPSLNLNNLLGTGNSNTRVEKGKILPQIAKPSTNSVVTAERKAAIVNKPAVSGNKLPALLPRPPDLPERHDIIGMKPPSHPEIFSGGFVPVVPGASGGFNPIVPDKANFSVGSVEKVNIGEIVDRKGPTPELIDPTNLPQSTTNFVSKRTHFTSTQSTETTSAEIPLDYLGATESEEELVTPEGEEPDEEIIEQSEDTSSRFGPTVTTPQLDTPKSKDKFEDIFKEVIDLPKTSTSVSSSSVTSSVSVATRSGSSKDVPTVTTASISAENDNKNIIGTPLSALLVPGGQVQNGKAAGRPSIKKVPNPVAATSTTAAHQEEFKNYFDDSELADVQSHQEDDGLSPMAHNGGPLEAESTGASSSDNMNWYFANYNKTSNLEPFVGGDMYPGSVSISGCEVITKFNGWFTFVSVFIAVNWNIKL